MNTNRQAFVGRSRELDELQRALDVTVSGNGQLVMLAGEPGIGKTRSVLEFTSAIKETKTRVLWGRCVDEQGSPAYWPWIQVIRSYVQQSSGRDLRDDMGVGVVDIAVIVPQIKDELPDIEEPLEIEPAQARFRLFDSIASFLRKVSQREPVVIILDDIHWADRSSLMLLEFIARETADCRVMILCLYRDTELTRQNPLNRTLAELIRLPNISQLFLRGLPADDVKRLVARLAGFDPPDELIDVLHERTEGNPFFVVEVASLLVQDGELTREGLPESERWVAKIPQGVRLLIGRRLDRLSPECNQALAIAAIIGREFSFPILDRLLDDVSEDALIDLLEEALSVGVIEEMQETPTGYQFTHALIQETLAAEFTSARRVRLHAKIAQNLETIYGDQVDFHASEVAHHLAEAEPLIGSDDLVKYSLIAGERALNGYAHEEAIAIFERALTSKEHLPMDSDTASLLFGMGRAQVATLQRQDALQSMRQAFEYCVETCDVTRAVNIAEHLPLIPGVEGVAQLISNALELTKPNSHDSARCLSRYGLALNYELGDYQGASKAFEEALKIASRLGDDDLEMRVLANFSSVDGANCQFEKCHSKSLRCIEMARIANQPYAEIRSHFWAMNSSHMEGNLDALLHHAEAALSLAEKLRVKALEAGSLFSIAITLGFSGDWAGGRRYSDRGLGSSPNDLRLLAVGSLAAFMDGDKEHGSGLLKRLEDVSRATVPNTSLEYAVHLSVMPTIARLTEDASLLDLAETSARTLLDSSAITPAVEFHHVRPSLALVAAYKGDREAAREQYEHLLASFETYDEPKMMGVTSSEGILGLLSATMGRLTDSVNHYQNAWDFCRITRHRYQQVWTGYEYAGVLLKRDETGDVQKAREILETSLEIAIESNMRILVERIQQLQSQFDRVALESDSAPAGLTRREAEVLKLIAAGKTNRDIAEELFITVPTAARHVSNIFSKIGVNNRTEAAAYSSRH